MIDTYHAARILTSRAIYRGWIKPPAVTPWKLSPAQLEKNRRETLRRYYEKKKEKAKAV